MDSLVSPLEIIMGGISRTDNQKESIDAFLEILLTSACGDCCIDPEFGFIFNNMRFEIFNEREGTIFNSAPKIPRRATTKPRRLITISWSPSSTIPPRAAFKTLWKNFTRRG